MNETQYDDNKSDKKINNNKTKHTRRQGNKKPKNNLDEFRIYTVVHIGGGVFCFIIIKRMKCINVNFQWKF